MEESGKLEETLGEALSPGNIVRRMVACQKDWDAINSMIKLLKTEAVGRPVYDRRGYTAGDFSKVG